MTYLSAPSDFELGSWYHVAGVYDGESMRLLVDGKQVAESTAQKGPIHYPDQAYFEMGAYHDKDEYFRLHGMLHEVRLYNRVLTETTLGRHYHALRQRFPRLLELADGPVLRFVSPTQATVGWWTDFKTPTRLVLQDGDRTQPFGTNYLTTEHEVTIDVPRRDTVYRYQIEAIDGGQTGVSEEFECDEFFNYATRSFPSAGATSLIDSDGNPPIRDGICVYLGADDIRIPIWLARNSRLRVIVFDADPVVVAKARRELLKAEIYGARIAVHHVESLTELRAVHGFANLVIFSQPVPNGNREQVAKSVRQLLIPDRGVGYLRIARRKADQPLNLEDREWHRVIRGPQDGTGEWSHQYGRADNSAFGGETLGEATQIGDLEILWLGRPGPRAQADRNGRKPSPLSTGGRLFTQGLNRLISLDAHNGTVLWSLEIPRIGRFNIPRDASNWCADETSVYIATGARAWQIDAATGEIVARHGVPEGPNQEIDFQWGYIGRLDGLLLGSTVKSDAPFTSFWGKDAWYDEESGPATFKICSDNLFAIDLSGQHVWNLTYGVIINSTITASDGTVFYVTSRNPKIVKSRSRRIGSPDLWEDLFVVAVDAASGSRLWDQPLDDVRHGNVVFYLAHGSDSLALVTSTNSKYGIYVFDPANGTRRWQTTLVWAKEGKADHGTHLQRPAIVADRLFVRPGVFDLITGEKLDIPFSQGSCGTYACTTHAMFFRYSNLAMRSSVDGTLSSWSRTRPGCWISTIPADGLLLSPEGGGGCSCGNWLETSIVFAPRAK